MFYVSDNPILADETEVLETLKLQTIRNGMDIFRTFKPSGVNIMTTCPFHKDGQERKPSFGISTVDMKCHCFTCGWAGMLDKMISNVLGYDDDGSYGREWLSSRFLSVSVEQRKPLALTLSRGAITPPKNVEFITEEELDSYRYNHPYMYQRGLTDEIIENFDIGYDSRTECLTFPVADLNKNIVFVARRGVKGKFFSYPVGAEKPVYCGERFVGGNYGEAIICESILNALTCWKFGKPAMALMGTGSAYQMEILKNLPVRKYILGFDPDEAGAKATKKLRKILGPHKLISEYVLPKGRDLNDLDSEVLKLQEVL